MQGSVTIIVSANGLTIRGDIKRQASAGLPPQDKPLEKAKSGTLSTRTTDTAGTLTLEAGHGITDGKIIDIFWVVAGVLKCAYSAIVGTVAGLDVPFTGASGEILPTVDSEITTQVQTVLDCDFDGDKQALIAGQMYYVSAPSPKGGHVIFEDSAEAVLFAYTFQGSEPMLWFTDNGFTNPITGNPVDEVKISNADSVKGPTFKLAGIYNSDQ